MRFGYLLSVGIILSCASRQHRPPAQLPPPKQVIEDALDNLRRQETFQFDWSLSRLKGEVKGDFTGMVEKGEVHLKGEWKFGRERESVDLVGIGDREYRWEDGKWTAAPRGEETSPLSQLERILSLGEFQLDRSEKGCLVYSFRPNVAFLDPLLQAETRGEIWIEEKLMLPKRVLVADEEKTLYWRFAPHSFGASVRVVSPLLKRHEFLLEGRDVAQASEILRRRLGLLGFSAFRTEDLGDGRMRLYLSASSNPVEELDEVVKRGVAEVFSAVYPKEPVYTLSEDFLADEYGEESVLGFEKGDRARPLVLLRRAISSQDLAGAEVSYDHLSRPWVSIKLKEGGGERIFSSLRTTGSEVVAIRVDGEVISAPKLRETAESLTFLKVNGELSVREAEILTAKINSGPLPCELKILDHRVLN